MTRLSSHRLNAPITLLSLLSQCGHVLPLSVCRMSWGWAHARVPAYLCSLVSIRGLLRTVTPCEWPAFHSSHGHSVCAA